MEQDEIKDTFSTLLSKQTVVWLLMGLLGSGSAIYAIVTYYNDSQGSIDFYKNYKPYDDAELRSIILKNKLDTDARISKIEAELSALNTSAASLNNTATSTANHLIRLQEKSGEATTTASEARTVAESNAREVKSAIANVREEMKTLKENLETRMKALQRATSNPLGTKE
jgi:gas vesicle protein